MAKYLAISIKINDCERPVVLMTDTKTKIDKNAKIIFDDIIVIPEKDGYEGCMNKLRIWEYSPFDETIFIDGDSILVKTDMNRHWCNFSISDVNIAGNIVNHGNWYGFNIKNIIRTLGIDYMVMMNSGVFYFKKSTITENFFCITQKLVSDNSDLLGCFHRRKTQLADEPFIGAAFGVMNMKPVYYPPDQGTVMVSTVNAKQCECDPINHISVIYKPERFIVLNRFFPSSWVRHSPSIIHFVGLKPKGIYTSACNMLRDAFQLKGVIG